MTQWQILCPLTPPSSKDAMASDRFEPSRTLPAEPESIARQRIRVTLRMLGSLLLGGMAIMGSVLVFRQGLLPLIDMAFQPGPAWLSVVRRTGIILMAITGYWAYVHGHEKRKATELQLQPVPLILGGVGGAALVALPIAIGKTPSTLGSRVPEWPTFLVCKIRRNRAMQSNEVIPRSL